MAFLRGVHDTESLKRFRPGSFLGRRRKIALDQIDTIENHFDPAVRTAFIEQFTDAHGVFKRTYPNRFDAFDTLILEEWGKRPLASDEVSVRLIDAAASIGSATLALFDKFEVVTSGRLHLVATDIDGPFTVLSLARDPERRLVLSHTGELVQIVWPPFVLGHRRRESLLFPLNRIVRIRAECYAKKVMDLWRAGDPDVSAREILLGDATFRAKLKSDRRLEFQTWDILQPWLGERSIACAQ